MLKFFFNKESKIVYVMEALGVIGIFTLIATSWPVGKTIIQLAGFYTFIGLYIFIRIFASLRWYRNAERYEGIELQFKKALVPTSYIMPMFSALLLLGSPAFVLYFADLLLIVIAHVNVILIYFHLRDHESLPVNYFTHNKHLTETSGELFQSYAQSKID